MATAFLKFYEMTMYTRTQNIACMNFIKDLTTKIAFLKTKKQVFDLIENVSIRI